MENALAVANVFIRLAMEANNPVTQMKLQKLIYFAHGWYLALADEPLVKEEFQAWQYGPVIPSVYHKFKVFGTLGIDRLGEEFCITSCGLELITPSISDMTGVVNSLLNRIWTVYGSFSGSQLSEMTHAQGSPWKQMRDKYGDKRDIVIPNNIIKSYFKGFINNEN